MIIKAVDFNADFIARMLLKLDWSVLKTTAESVRVAYTNPRDSCRLVGTATEVNSNHP